VGEEGGDGGEGEEGEEKEGREEKERRRSEEQRKVKSDELEVGIGGTHVRFKRGGRRDGGELVQAEATGTRDGEIGD